MPRIDYRLIDDYMRADSKKIQRATRNTLNDLAFFAQKRITREAPKDMSFRKNVKNSLGFKVKRASYGDLEAEIYTDRGWLYWHLEEGKRKAKSGLRFRGVNYIVVPIVKSAFTVKKKLKQKFAKRMWIGPTKAGPVIFYRPSANKSIAIAVLKKQVEHHEDIEPDKIIKRVFEQHGLKKLRKELNYRRK